MRRGRQPLGSADVLLARLQRGESPEAIRRSMGYQPRRLSTAVMDPASRQKWEDTFAAARETKQALEESGEAKIQEFQKRLDFATWGLATQGAVGEASVQIAQKVLGLVGEGRTLAAAGQPDTMPDVAWSSFRESLDAAELNANRHVDAWSEMQQIVEAAEARGDVVEIRGGEVVIIKSATAGRMARNIIIFGGVAALVGGAYWVWSRNQGGAQ